MDGAIFLSFRLVHGREGVAEQSTGRSTGQCSRKKAAYVIGGRTRLRSGTDHFNMEDEFNRPGV